jgi:hypothetical protein
VWSHPGQMLWKRTCGATTCVVRVAGCPWHASPHCSGCGDCKEVARWANGVLALGPHGVQRTGQVGTPHGDTDEPPGGNLVDYGERTIPPRWVSPARAVTCVRCWSDLARQRLSPVCTGGPPWLVTGPRSMAHSWPAPCCPSGSAGRHCQSWLCRRAVNPEAPVWSLSSSSSRSSRTPASP